MSALLTLLLVLPLLAGGTVLVVVTAVALDATPPAPPARPARRGVADPTSTTSPTPVHVGATLPADRVATSASGRRPARPPLADPPGHPATRLPEGRPGALLRVTIPGGTMIHLVPRAEDAPRWTFRTMCGMPWREPADDAAEVAAMTASLGRRALPGVSVCPVCTSEALPLP